MPFVVGEDIFTRQSVEDVEVPNHGIFVRVALEGGGEEKLATHSAWIIEAHGELAANDFLFFLILVFGQRGFRDNIEEDVETDFGSRSWGIDPIDCAVKGRVSVDVTACVLDLRGDFWALPFARALEEHVFENVRESRRLTIHLHGCYRRHTRPGH